MDVAQIRGLKPRLDDYLARFADCFARCDTREHLAVYVRGQLSDLAQKSVEPIALAAGIPPRTLQEFLARYKWDENALRRRLHHTVGREHACPRSIGLIDETSDPKKGVQAPGVRRQHCGAVGKQDDYPCSMGPGGGGGGRPIASRTDSGMATSATSPSEPVAPDGPDGVACVSCGGGGRSPAGPSSGTLRSCRPSGNRASYSA